MGVTAMGQREWWECLSTLAMVLWASGLLKVIHCGEPKPLGSPWELSPPLFPPPTLSPRQSREGSCFSFSPVCLFCAPYVPRA